MKRETIIPGILIGLFSLSIILAIANKPVKSDSTTTNNPLRLNGVAVISINGPITSRSNNFFNQSSPQGIVNQLRNLAKSPRVKALVVHVNSPGGAPGSSQEIYSEIKRFKEVKDVPVIVSIGDIAASGGYWIALAGDTIFSNPASLVGNIGVIMTNLNLTQVPQRYGIGMTTYKSGAYKDLLSSWRQPTARDKAIIRSLIQNVHVQFTKTVAENRDMTMREALQISNGQLFTGEQAVEYKLVDKLGGLYTAIEYANDEAGLPDPPVIINQRRPAFKFMMPLLKSMVDQLPLTQLSPYNMY